MIDVAVVGGGIAGLWTLNRLRALGYNAHLFEKTALGTGQTIASQGIIHGGIKYALNSVFSPVAPSLRAMPERWLACLEGHGEIDLRPVKVLSQKHGIRLNLCGHDVSMWSFCEPVIDVRSLLETLRDNQPGHVHLGEPEKARLTIYTCGIGNERRGYYTQRRPLRMFMVRHMWNDVFAHYIGTGANPRVTITTHGSVWYLGGQIAERAVGLDDAAALVWAKSEMEAIFPKERWSDRQWAIHDVDRAEPAAGKALPDRPKVSIYGEKAVAWPTKLALAPVMADELVAWVRSKAPPSGNYTHWEAGPVPVAPCPWETAQWH